MRPQHLDVSCYVVLLSDANGGIVDVHVERKEEPVAVEIAITSPARASEHIAACLEAGDAEIISLVVSETTRAELQWDLPRSFDEDTCRRVQIVPATQVGSIF
jgi:hypothetical protein